MATINLLPWREERREEKKKEFLMALGLIAIVAVGLLVMVDRYFNNAISNQNQLNDYLREQITRLDGRIVEIRNLQAQKTELTERMSVIQDLQGTRPVIVRVFDELVKTLPEGVYYNTITRTGDRIRLEGVADSNDRVSSLMRALGASEWFSSPDLQQVRADASLGAVPGGTRFAFTLTVQVTMPNQET